MGTELSPTFYDKLQKHLESGVPLKDMAFREDQRIRIEVCLQTFNQLQDNPQMNIGAYLKRRGRTLTEIRQDRQVIDYLLAELGGDSKELSRYRVKEAAKKAMRMGEAAGDWKPLLKGAEMLTKIEGLDEPETSMDLEAQTYTLGPLLVPAPKNGVEVSDAELDRIRRKYHAEKDKTQEMVEAKLGMFVEAGSHLSDEDFPLPEPEPITIHSPIYSPVGEPTMFDADDPDDDGK